MNLLNLTAPGGFPLRQDRLNFLQEEVRLMFFQFAKAFIADGAAIPDVVVSGCDIELSGSNVVASEGLVYFNNELWYAPAASIPVVATPIYQIWYYAEELIDDPAGIKQYLNGSTNPTQKIRRAKLTLGTYGSGTAYNAALTALQASSFVVKSTTNADAADWSSVIRLSGNIHGRWAELQYSSVAWRNIPGAILYKKDLAGNVTVCGSKLNPATSPTSGLIGNLPVGFRPETDVVCFWGYSGSPKFVKIQPDGDVQVINDDLSNSPPAYGAMNVTYKAVD